METGLAGNLNKFGYHAVTASNKFRSIAFKGMTEKQAIHKLRDKGIQDVVTITLVNKDMQKQYVPSTYGYNPGFRSYYSPWSY